MIIYYTHTILFERLYIEMTNELISKLLHNLKHQFSMDNVHYLLNKGINNWYIYKHFLKFSYQPLDEEDLQQTLVDLLETYE